MRELDALVGLENVWDGLENVRDGFGGVNVLVLGLDALADFEEISCELDVLPVWL